MSHTIAVLGGYGFFGRRICKALASEGNITLLIAGRRLDQAQALAIKLGLPECQGIFIDAMAPDLAHRLSTLGVNTVIHTAGPYQGQDYTVARAAIEAGANYLDLSDGRAFVEGIVALDAAARAQGVLVTSGASSLPALSSAVVDRYLPRFQRLQVIRHAISSDATAPGLATMQGVFSYCGKPFARLQASRPHITYGWLDTIQHKFPAPVGHRLLGSCDVPDLTLFPARYDDLQTISFHAGFASPIGHSVVWAAAQLTRLGLIRNMRILAKPLHRLSQRVQRWMSDKSAMVVAMQGVGLDGKPLNVIWYLLAGQNHGSYIPCGASIALAKKLAAQDVATATAAGTSRLPTGAMPCMGLITVEEYLDSLTGFDIKEIAP